MNIKCPNVNVRPRPLIAVACLFIASCGEDVLGPLNNTVFVLRTVDGQNLPATVVHEMGGLAWVVTADTIWFESGSKWRRHSVQHREEGVGGDPLDVETDGTVTIQDGVLWLDFDCPDGDCIAPDRMTGDASGLEMDRTYLHDGSRMIFEPI